MGTGVAVKKTKQTESNDPVEHLAGAADNMHALLVKRAAGTVSVAGAKEPWADQATGKRVESKMGAVAWGQWPTLRFPSPLIEP